MPAGAGKNEKREWRTPRCLLMLLGSKGEQSDTGVHTVFYFFAFAWSKAFI